MTSIARVTEISAQSPNSFEEAIETGLERANATLRNVSGAWIKTQEVEMRDGSIEGYKVKMHVTFVLD